MQSVDQLQFALSWVFSRGILIDSMGLQLEFLQSGDLQKLFAGNIHAIKGGITILCSEDFTALSTAAYFIQQVLVDKVDNVGIALLRGSTPAHLPGGFLPFHQMKFLSWSESQPQTDGQCLVSTIANSLLLEGLDVCRDGNLPAGFFEALSLRSETLADIQYEVSLLTDHDLQQTARICVNLVILDIALAPGAVSRVTDVGIIAVAKCCRNLEDIKTHDIPLTGASLSALFTHCVHLSHAKCEGAELDANAILALCRPNRVAHLEEFACTWAVSTQLDVSNYEQAFCALWKFWVSKVVPDSCHTLCAALRVMPKLQDFFACPSDAQQPTPVSVDMLIALAEGPTTALYDVNFGLQIVGEAECSLVAIIQKSRNLSALHIDNIADGVTDAVVFALAENCAKLAYLSLSSAKLITDSSVATLASSCPCLDRLILRKCTSLTDKSILALAQHCPALWHLDVRDSPRVSESALAQLLQSCPRIETLEVSPESITKAAAKRLQDDMKVKGALITRAEVPVLTRMAGRIASVWVELNRWWSAVAAVGVHPL
jgi:hypothetical protein